MSKLSAKRHTNALLYGQAVARGFLKDYAENPSRFPKGLESLENFAPGFARHVGLSLPTGNASSEEEDLAEAECRKTLQLVIAVAKRYKEEDVDTRRHQGAEGQG